MQIPRWTRATPLRALWFALFLCLIPASSRASVLISVGFAPPPLPVIAIDDQPPCPEAGWIWTPGYWAYGSDGYYWVPGTWVAAPEPGLYWTPGYWGWSTGLYLWHPGYWGPHVGYYGGVNYGFGYFGVGFVGGMWHGRDFAYNTAVVRVNTTVVRNVYVDRTVVVNHTVVNNHVAFVGGPGGINHPPAPEERAVMNEHHFAATSLQAQHENIARNDRAAYFNSNHGAPSHVAVDRPQAGTPRAGFAPPHGDHGNMRPNNNVQPNGSHENMPQNNVRPNGEHGNPPANMNDRRGFEQPRPNAVNPPERPQYQQRQAPPQQSHQSRQPVPQPQRESRPPVPQPQQHETHQSAAQPHEQHAPAAHNDEHGHR